MTDYFAGATFEENGHVIRKAYRGMDNLVGNVVQMKHKIPLSELIAYVEQNARNVPFDRIDLNWATVSWEDDATPEEIAAWQAREARKLAATEKWEREMLAKLTEKYGARS